MLITRVTVHGSVESHHLPVHSSTQNILTEYEVEWEVPDLNLRRDLISVQEVNIFHPEAFRALPQSIHTNAGIAEPSAGLRIHEANPPLPLLRD
jgi:hypothetical protein